MDFVVFVDTKKNNLVEQIQLPNGTSIDLNKKPYTFDEMNEYIDYGFSIFYSNGVVENARLKSVGTDFDGTPMFMYDLLDDRKGELDDE